MVRRYFWLGFIAGTVNATAWLALLAALAQAGARP